MPRLADLPSHDYTCRIPLAGPSIPSRHVITAVRRGATEQPTIVAGLAALDEVVRSHFPELVDVR